MTKNKYIKKNEGDLKVLLYNETDLVLATIVRKVPMKFETLLIDSKGFILNYSKNIGELFKIYRSQR